VKVGVILFLAGLGLGLVAPLAASALSSGGLIGTEVVAEVMSTMNQGMAHYLSSAAWSGVYLGAFGALSGAVTPVIDYAFGERAFFAADQSQHAQGISQPQHDVSQAAAPQHDVSATHFQDMVAAQKVAAAKAAAIIGHGAPGA